MTPFNIIYISCIFYSSIQSIIVIVKYFIFSLLFSNAYYYLVIVKLIFKSKIAMII